MNESKFIYDVSIMLEMNFKDFDLLYNAASNHYDYRVRESTTQGFFMFGKRNRRNWTFEDDDLTFCFEDQWKSSELNLMMKAIEMTWTEESFALQLKLKKAFFEIQEEYKKLNNL